MDLTESFGSGLEPNIDVLDTITYFNGTSTILQKTVKYGSSYGNLPTPTRTGYTFTGWWTTAESSSGGVQVTSSTSVTTLQDHTLYARWT